MTRTLAAFAVFVFALSISISTFAGSKSQYVTLYRDVQLNGKTIPAGDYTVKCDTTGSNAQITFLKNGKEVASANGQVKKLDPAPPYDQIVTQDGHGTRSISEIDFAGSKTGVTFDASSMSSAGSN